MVPDEHVVQVFDDDVEQISEVEVPVIKWWQHSAFVVDVIVVVELEVFVVLHFSITVKAQVSIDKMVLESP